MNHNRVYTGNPELVRRTEAPDLPRLNLANLGSPEGYLPDEGLVDAVNVALMLRQPLLLTGEPGTGKTKLAASVAWELGLGEPLLFETKSTSVSRDLFYTFDTLSRFQIAHDPSQDIDPRQFIKYNALGKAILHTQGVDQIRDLIGSNEVVEKPRQSVVLIDEIDKAPRDFPNDILNEIELLYFRIPELGGKTLKANDEIRPIVIMTSNSEKGLPDAFLRRCIFYHIPFPDEERLQRIVLTRVSEIKAEQNIALNDMLDFFDILREQDTALRKRPGTAELLNWATALVGSGVDPATDLRSQQDKVIRTLCTLYKHQEDQTTVIQRFKAWVHER